MPDWKAPFKLPRLSSAEFKERKRKYVEKNGYTYSLPTLAATFNYPLIRPISLQEQEDYTKKKFDKFSDQRLAEITFLKEKRKQRYLEMLGSPVPDVLRARSSIITAIDNAQDAVSTLISIVRLGVRWLPKFMARAIAGPAGFVWATNDLLNISREIISPEMKPREAKRLFYQTADKNPYSKTARVERRKQFLDGKIHRGAFLEAAQVTKDIFGYGITLGPIFAMPENVIFGHIRASQGKTVRPKMFDLELDYWKLVARKILPALLVKYTDPFETNTQDAYLDGLLLLAAHQTIGPIKDQVINYDNLNNLGNQLIRAPAPTNLITRDIIREAGDDPDQNIAWPSTGKEYSTINELIDRSPDLIKDKIDKALDAEKGTQLGYEMAQNIDEAALYMAENATEKDGVIYGHQANVRFIGTLLEAGYVVPLYSTPNDIQKVANLIDSIASEDEKSDIGTFLVRYGRTPKMPQLADYGTVYIQPDKNKKIYVPIGKTWRYLENPNYPGHSLIQPLITPQEPTFHGLSFRDIAQIKSQTQ